MTQYYTGVGSRKTPTVIQGMMAGIAWELGQRGYTLRSGAADGADKAFEISHGYPKQIFTTDHWRDGSNHWSYDEESWHEAQKIAALTHPAWNHCNSFVRKLHTRNVFQVLGLNLRTPSECVICWTPDGAITEQDCSIKTGGTGTAIRIASKYGIPVYNLQRRGDRERLIEKLVEE
jgi:hypothetical protein